MMLEAMFKDRVEAGRELAKHLLFLRGKNSMVLAIPRGGVPVGFEIVKILDADFSLIISRKLPYPNAPESGFGAIAENGNIFIIPQATFNLSKKEISAIIENQKREILRRIEVLRGGRPLPEMSGRIVILVDDGIAMGSTMMASITLCKNQKPSQLIIASPVSSPEVAQRIEALEGVDKTIILLKPKFFRAVAQVYEHWHDVPDHEVLEIMRDYRHHFAKH